MIKLNWEVRLAFFLVAATVLIYSVKYFVFHNPGDTLNYLFNSLGFLPVSVLLVTIVLNKLLTVRSRQDKLEKLNMVIGTFFSEVGVQLIKDISRGDPEIGRIKDSLVVENEWGSDEFESVRKMLSSYDYPVEISAIDICPMKEFLLSRRDFMLRLLENPVLLEHESFTGLLRAVFHLAEELKWRSDLSCLPESDYAHLSGDLKRVYENLIIQWLDYMEYLRRHYPYLFSLEMRTNPFDEDASPVVSK